MQVRMKDGREYKYIFSPTSYIKHKRFTEWYYKVFSLSWVWVLYSVKAGFLDSRTGEANYALAPFSSYSINYPTSKENPEVPPSASMQV
jgi:hypothetical protein